MFQVYNIIIKCLYILQHVHHQESSFHTSIANLDPKYFKETQLPLELLLSVNKTKENKTKFLFYVFLKPF